MKVQHELIPTLALRLSLGDKLDRALNLVRDMWQSELIFGHNTQTNLSALSRGPTGSFVLGLDAGIMVSCAGLCMFTFVVSEAFVATGGDEDFELLNSLLKTCAVLMRSSRGSALSRHFYHLQPDPVVHCGKSSV